MSASQAPLGPLYFEPVYQPYVWGGDRIARVFRRPLPPGIYAESWEISTRPEGMSVVADGPLKGETLEALVRTFGARLMGNRFANGPFPLLLKIIDARERLSLQVHPSDETAAQAGGDAKTELWIVLDADPEAGVFAGLRPGVDRHAFEQALAEQDCERVLQRHAVTRGEAIFIPGGTVHAIDAGCLLLEIQQNSNTTYRIFDWGRVGADGKPRETHPEQALAVVDFSQDPAEPRCPPIPLPPQGGSLRVRIHESRWFRIERVEVQTRWSPADTNGDVELWFLAEGKGSLHWTSGVRQVTAGQSLLIPAETRGLCLLPEDPRTTLLRIRPGKDTGAENGGAGMEPT